VPDLMINVFGKFNLQLGSSSCLEIGSAAARQLLCYLLLNRGSAHSREALADRLWPDATADLANTRLRKALWHLRNSLDVNDESLSEMLLIVRADWLQVDMDAVQSLDCAVFEGAFTRLQGVRGGDLGAEEAEALRTGVASFQGGLRENWYQDWYNSPREQFHQMHLMLLDKLMDYYEAHGQYEKGLAHGFAVLQEEPARESTHRRQMRLYALLGDRSAALHQYDICVRALENELGVEPSRGTTQLNQVILAGRYQEEYSSALVSIESLKMNVTASEMARSLATLRRALGDFERFLRTQPRQGAPVDAIDVRFLGEPACSDTPVPPTEG